MVIMDDMSLVYNLNLCRLCQIPKHLDLLQTTKIVTQLGETYLDLLRFIFHDIIWIEDELISLACQVCLEKVKDIATFKRLCLETNRRRGALTFDTVQVGLVTIKVEEDDGPEIETVLQLQQRVKRKPSILEKDQSKDIKLLKINSRTKRKKKDATLKECQDECNNRGLNRPVKLEETQVSDENIETKNVTKKVGSSKKRIKLYVPAYQPNDKEKNCRLCKKEFSTFKELEAHINNDHVKLSYPCDSCQESFKSLASLYRHIFKHNGIKNYVCSICGKKFVTNGDLCHHKNRHAEDRKFACKICPDKKFRTIDSLIKHRRIIHTDPKDYKYLCTECGKKFALSSWLKDHMFRHNNIKNFRCHLCDKSFCTKTEMRRHTSTHSNVRPFKCDLCPAEYKRRDFLLGHKIKIHGTENNKLTKVKRNTLNVEEMSIDDATDAKAEPTDGASNKPNKK